MILVITIVLKVQNTYNIQTTYVQFVEWFYMYDIIMYHSNQEERGFMCDMSLVRVQGLCI